MTSHIFMIAVESSADHLGAGLIKNLRELEPDFTLSGIGGAAMRAQGVASDFDISALSILGFSEAVMAYPIVLERVKVCIQDILKAAPDMVILIDSWGFTMRVAKGLRRRGYTGQIIKYVAPQVWAMREGRARILAQSYDHVLSIHSFDAPYFEKYGLPVTYVGNPIFDTDYRAGNGAGLRDEFGIAANKPIVAVLFGSRLSEIQNLVKPFADTVAALKTKCPDVQFIAPLSEAVEIDVKAAAAADLRMQDIILLPEARKFDVFSAVNAALACSGTVTTQLACAGVPTVVAYKLSAPTFFVAKRLFKPPHISLVNIAADHALMPEFMQNDVNGDTLSDAILPYLSDAKAAQASSEALLRQTQMMKGEGGAASQRAAQAVISLLK